jgi:DNA-directed RNA polymerase subunit beta'
MRTTLGRELIRQKLPDKFKSYADQVLDKKKLTELMTKLAQDDPDGYVDILQALNNLGQTVVSLYGRNTALPFEDIKISKGVKSLNAQLHAVIDKVLDDPNMTEKQKEDKITDLCYKYTKRVEDAVFADNDRRSTAFASQINSGSRGNKTQLMQMQFGNMGMKDALNRDMPYMMIDPYALGASPMGYWVSASSGRKGYYDVQAATGQAGYLGKRVTAATHDTVISEDDCGTTDTGIPFPANDNKNVGAVLLRPWHNYPAGTVVTDKMVGEADDDEEMILRSPMTCKSKNGICAKCSGIGENGKFPGIGEYVPMNAARSFVEVITQAGVGSKHKGGVGGRKVEDPEGNDQPTGFRSVERMFTTPKNFPGGAVLAPVDGTVTAINPAAQGGFYITVGDKTVYASPARTVKVKVGDRMYAGDVLTNGIPNPMEIVSYKGLGEGRRYFTNKLNKVLADQGWGTDRRNIESFTRAFLNKVEITDPDGFGNFLPGDVLNYSEVAAEWEPRKDSVTTKADKAMNMYLEKPVLYYSVGTRITPEVANTLKKYKFDDVTVSDKEPPFSAKFLRPAESLQHSKYWLPRFAGERLRDSLFDAAQQGITDPYDSPSYVDKIVAQPFKP